MFSFKSLFLLFILLATHLSLTHAIQIVHKRDDYPLYTGRGSIDPNPQHKVYRHYTAIGDRIAAGTNPDRLPIENDTAYECGRSLHAYPFSFADEFGPSISLTNFNFPACAANTTILSMYDQLGSGISLSPLPRIWYDFGQPDLVTVSIGAMENELYPELRAHCVDNIKNNFKPSNPKYIEECTDAIRKAYERVNKSRQSTEELFQFVRKIGLAPGQKREVYVLGLAQPFSATESYCGLKDKLPPKRLLREWNKVVGFWNTMLADEADNAGIRYVDVDRKFHWRRICDRHPWLYADGTSSFLFPNANGSAQIRDALAEEVLGIVIRREELPPYRQPVMEPQSANPYQNWF